MFNMFNSGLTVSVHMKSGKTFTFNGVKEVTTQKQEDGSFAKVNITFHKPINNFFSFADKSGISFFEYKVIK